MSGRDYFAPPTNLFIDVEDNAVKKKESKLGYAVVFLGVEYSTPVFCCGRGRQRHWELGNLVRGQFPSIRSYLLLTRGEVNVDKTPPANCETPHLIATVHSHNFWVAMVRQGGLEDVKILNGEPSIPDQDVANENNVLNYEVIEDGAGNYTAGIAKPKGKH